jgi:hypothetical protein
MASEEEVKAELSWARAQTDWQLVRTKCEFVPAHPRYVAACLVEHERRAKADQEREKISKIRLEAIEKQLAALAKSPRIDKWTFGVLIGGFLLAALGIGVSWYALHRPIMPQLVGSPNTRAAVSTPSMPEAKTIKMQSVEDETPGRAPTPVPPDH